jgi:hypothetical protein
VTDTVTLELGGTSLLLDDPANGLQCTQVDLGWPDVRTVAEVRPLVDGTIDSTQRFGARAVSLAVAALDSNAGTWKQALARLAQFLGAAARPTLVLNLGGVNYRMGLAPDQSAAPFENPHHARVQLAFRTPDPYLYTDMHTAEVRASSTPGVGRTYPLIPPRTYPTSNSFPGLVTIDNQGIAITWPTVRVIGPLTNSAFSITNQTTGQTFSLSAMTIPAGTYLEIDMRERTVRLNGDPNLSRFSSVNFTTSQWVGLIPGANDVRFQPVTGDVVILVDWADPYLWPGGATA